MPTQKKHCCHAQGCNIPVPPKLLFCAEHWQRLPTHLQDEISQAYRPGQENDKRPSLAYVRAQMTAINWIAKREGRALIDIDKRIKRLEKWLNP